MALPSRTTAAGRSRPTRSAWSRNGSRRTDGGVDAEAAARAQAISGGGRRRLDPRARDWVGIPIADALGLDIGLNANGKLKPLRDIDPFEAAARQTVVAAIVDWIDARWLKVVEELDDRRMPREFVRVEELVLPVAPERPETDDDAEGET